MKGSDISSHVATHVSLPKYAATAAGDTDFSAISDAFASEEIVTPARSGTCSTKGRPARQGHNPRTGESIFAAPSKWLSCRVGKTIRDAVA